MDGFMNNLVAHSKTTVTPADVAAVANQVASGIVSHDEPTKKFEKHFSQYCGDNKFGYATSSGTLADYLALVLLDLPKGSKVAISSYLCRDVLSAIWQTGLSPLIVDCDDTYNLDFRSLSNMMRSDLRAIIITHQFGMPAEIERFKVFGVPIIEDLAHSIGAKLNGKRVGSDGDVIVSSFHGIKMLACGEGGIVITNNDSMIRRCQHFLEPDYDNGEFKLKFPMSAMQAALGLSQLSRMDEMVARRRYLAQRYNQAFSDLDCLLLPVQMPAMESCVFRYVVEFRGEIDLKHLMERYLELGVVIRRPIIVPLHRITGDDDESFPRTLQAFSRAFSLPIYPSLTEHEQDKVIETTFKIFHS
jgi:dTDP-4-amino-4,6-dideoxygalactose transaminase